MNANEDFANYVKEKTGIEPEIRYSPELGAPCVYFGPEFEKAFDDSHKKKEDENDQVQHFYGR